MPTVAVLIIGNEILTGKFPDENGPFLIRRLRELGADLQRLVVVPDVVEVIAEEVRRCSEAYDHVITTGGVGPTHDDVTLPGVAAGLGLPLVVHPTMVDLMARWGIARNEATERMALLPEGTLLRMGEDTRFPAVRVGNVTVLPGVPRLAQRKFDQVAADFAGTPPHTARLYCPRPESEIAIDLDEVQRTWPTVAIGSYPRFGEAPVQVIITLESQDAGALEAAVAALRGRLVLL